MDEKINHTMQSCGSGGEAAAEAFANDGEVDLIYKVILDTTFVETPPAGARLYRVPPTKNNFFPYF